MQPAGAARILALDLGRTTGYAIGGAGSKPTCGSIRLIKPSESITSLPAALARFVRDLIETDHPDLIVREAWMAPAAQRSQDVIIAHLLMAGAVMAIAGINLIECRDVAVQTWRRHFCGRATANPRSHAPRSAAQREADRHANKEMVLNRARLLAYLPRDSKDIEAADAAGIWDWSSVHFGRAVPRELVLYGEGAA